MNEPRISLRQLEAFVALSETHHFGRAALNLGISQPTLTSQIAALERNLGARLFERSSAGSLPTSMARELLEDARRVLESHRALLDRARSLPSGPTGTYRLGITPTLGPYLLPHILPDLHQRYAGLKLYVREAAPRNLEQGLLHGEHDLVLTPLPISATSQLTVVELFRETLQLVMPADHPLAGQTTVRPADLAGQPVLTLEEHHHLHWQVESLCQRFGARLLRDYEGTSLDTLRQMVVMGMGLSFLPALYVHSEIHQPEELRVTQVEGRRIERVHALAWRTSAPNPELFHQLAEDIHRSVQKRLGAYVEALTQPAAAPTDPAD